MNKMPSLADNLRFLMARENLTVTEFARRIKIPQPVLYRMYVGRTYNPNVLSLSPIAKYFNISISQLIGDEFLEHRPADSELKIHYVPVINWADAINWPNNKKSIAILENVFSDAQGSANTFGVIVDDEIFGFIKGTVLIFDPAKTPKHKEYALVKKNVHDIPLVKQILIEHDSIYLKPLNTFSQTVAFDDTFSFLGVLIQWTSIGKRKS